MIPLAFTFSLSRGYPVWFFILMAVVCLGLITWFYINNAQTLPRWYFAVLFALRLIVIVVLLMYIFQPELVFQRFFTKKPTMVVLLDTSASMSHSDPKVGERIEVAKTNLRQGGFLNTLSKQFTVRLYRFGATAQRITLRQLKEVEADGELTDMAASASHSLAKHTQEHVVGAVLLSDGIDNSGKKPVEKLVALGVPFHTVGFGVRIEAAEDFRNVAVTSVEHDDFVAKDNTTEIKVFVDARGYGNRPARVALKSKDGKELASQEVVLDAQKGAQRVVMKFTPTKMGRIDGHIEVEPLPDEAQTADNRKAITINVTGPKIKVLYIEGVLRSEGKWLMRTLQTDPNVELLYLVKSREGKFLQRGNIQGLTLNQIPTNLQTWKRFDVIILGDVHRSLFTNNQLLDIKEAVLDGRGLLLMGGVTALGPGKYVGTPIEQLAPVWFGSATIGQENGDFIWQLTDDGAVHPIFSGIERFFPTKERAAEQPMQKLAGCTRVAAAKPIASVLAVHPSAKGPDGKPMAVIAVQNAGTGRSMIITADTTHRWYLPNRGLGRENPYVKLWGQAIRWLASEEVKRDQKPGITAYTDKSEYEPGEEVRLVAYVRDSEGQATGEAAVYVSVVDPSKRRTRLDLPKVDGKLGEYRVTFRPETPGKHTAVFSAKQAGTQLGKDVTVDFTVGRPDLEMAELSLNETLLKQIADRTGGTYCSWLGLKDLADSLTAEQDRKSEPVKVKLYHGPLFMILFIAVAACEWYMRKRVQLA